MTKTMKLRPSPALLVAFVALFVAMGGVGYSAIKLKKNAVKTKNIKDGAVTTPKLSADAKAPEAGNADRLGGRAASLYQAASASTEDATDNPLDDTFETIGQTLTIDTVGTKRVIATASVAAEAPGDDFVNCRIKVDGNVGLSYSQVIADNATFASTTGSVSPLVSAVVPAGEHTVTLECSGQAATPDAVVTDSALAAWAVSD